MRWLLRPLAALFGLGVRLRNWCFDHGLFLETQHKLPIVCIGNLAVGGTGKTPHTQLIASLLLAKGKRVGILSRGYGRRSKGFHWVKASDQASQVGDEPLQMRLQLPHSQLHCAVCENRNKGIRRMLEEHPQLEVILLDDAFQHRWVKPSLSIVLTDYACPYDQDSLLPEGRLREPQQGAERAQIIIVTRCPATLSALEAETLRQRLCTSPQQQCFFTSIAYDPLPPIEQALLITGIAHPQPLVEHLEQEGISVDHLAYPDHHRFTASDRQEILSRSTHYSTLLTTAKDAVRLAELQLPEETHHKMHIVQISPHFLFSGLPTFTETLHHYV